MDAEQVGRLLKATPTLAALDASDLELVAESCRVRVLKRGQFLFAEGDPADSFVVVASGRLRVLVTSADGGELVLSVLGPGDSLGEVGCLDGGARSATVEVLQDSVVVQLPSGDLLALVERRPQVARDLLAQMASLLRRLTGATSDLVFLDVPRRVAKVLAQAADEAGEGDLEVADTQSQIGARVGGTRQSVNAALHALERRGWIEVSGRHIAIRDVQALRRFASP